MVQALERSPTHRIDRTVVAVTAVGTAMSMRPLIGSFTSAIRFRIASWPFALSDFTTDADSAALVGYDLRQICALAQARELLGAEDLEGS